MVIKGYNFIDSLVTRQKKSNIMAKYIYLFILIVFLSCQKDEIVTQSVDDNYTDMHDTIISVQWANGGRDFNLDIDNDSIDDVKFTVYSYYSKYVGSKDYLQVTPLNGFELAFTKHQTTTWRLNAHWVDTLLVTDTVFVIDTVLVPKVFNLGDTIFWNDKYSAESQMINYSDTPSSAGAKYYSGLRYGIKKGGYFYLGFHKLYNEKSRLAWLKVNPILYGIIFNSSCYIDNEKLVIIEKI